MPAQPPRRELERELDVDAGDRGRRSPAARWPRSRRAWPRGRAPARPAGRARARARSRAAGRPSATTCTPPGPASTGNGGGRSGTIAPSGLNGNVACHSASAGRSCSSAALPARSRSAGGRRRRRARRPGSSAAARRAIASTGKRQSAWTKPSDIARRHGSLHGPVLPRADAVATLTAEPFDVLVIGGGITGAGVALDAATRGYSRRADRAQRLRQRHLLALEQARPRRSALPAELRSRARARGAAGAPDQRQPRAAPRAAAAVRRPRLRRRAAGPGRRARPERLRRDGGRPAPAPAPRAPGGRLEPGAPPRDLRRRGERAAAGARRPLADRRLPVLRLPDRRRPARADRAGRGRALRRGGRQPARGGRAARRTTGARPARACATRETGEELEIRATNVVNATGVWADRLRPAELHDEAEVPIIRPEPRHHLVVEGAALPMAAGAIVPAGEGRTIFVLPWLGQTLIGTTDTDHDGDADHVQPVRGRDRVPARRRQRVLRHRADARPTSPARTPACGR